MNKLIAWTKARKLPDKSPKPSPSKSIVHSASKRSAADAEAQLEFTHVADGKA